MCVSLKAMCASTKAFFQCRIKAQSEPAVPVGTNISPPYGFKHETVQIPGLGLHELQMLREQAAASRVGVAEERAVPRAPAAPKVPVCVGVAEETAEPRPVTPMVVTTTKGAGGAHAHEEDMVALSPHNQLGKVAGSVSTNEL